MVQDVCPRMRRGGCGFCTAAGWAESSRVLWNSSLRVKSPPKTMVGGHLLPWFTPLPSSPGQGEVPGHPQQVHGDPWDSLL